jgi:hypothetical protein
LAHACDVKLAIALSEHAAGLEISATSIRWSGPTDPEDGAPVVSWELTGDGVGEIVVDDPVAFAPLVAAYPMPVTMLADLARHCVKRDAAACVPVAHGTGFDARWARAVAAALIEIGGPLRVIPDDPGEIVTSEKLHELRAMPDGTIAALNAGTREVVVGTSRYALPKSDELDARDWFKLFDGRGVPAVDVPPRDMTMMGVASGWLLTFTGEHFVAAQGWLAKELVWTHLERNERVVFPWERLLFKLVEVEGVLWGVSTDGLWKLVGGEEPVRVWSGSAWGLAIDRGVAWMGLRSTSFLASIDLATGAEIMRMPAEQYAHDVWRVPGGVVIGGFRIIVDGKIVATSEPRSTTGVAVIADGTAAVSSGEQVAILEASGAVRWRAPMPYNGAVRCATRDRFVFGPNDGVFGGVEPDALIAFDREGRITARLPGKFQGAIVSDGEWVYANESNRGLLRWNPRGEASAAVPAPPVRRATERGVTRLGYVTHNPRDDWPEIGIEIAQCHALLIDGTYGGSTGVSPGLAVQVTDGAIATFVGCNLTQSVDGEVVQRGATVFAIGCQLPVGMRWTLGRDCHFVAIDCSNAPGQTVIASGQGANVFAAR